MNQQQQQQQQLLWQFNHQNNDYNISNNNNNNGATSSGIGMNTAMNNNNNGMAANYDYRYHDNNSLNSSNNIYDMNHASSGVDSGTTMTRKIQTTFGFFLSWLWHTILSRCCCSCSLQSIRQEWMEFGQAFWHQPPRQPPHHPQQLTVGRTFGTTLSLLFYRWKYTNNSQQKKIQYVFLTLYLPITLLLLITIVPLSERLFMASNSSIVTISLLLHPFVIVMFLFYFILIAMSGMIQGTSEVYAYYFYSCDTTITTNSTTINNTSNNESDATISLINRPDRADDTTSAVRDPQQQLQQQQTEMQLPNWYDCSMKVYKSFLFPLFVLTLCIGIPLIVVDELSLWFTDELDQMATLYIETISHYAYLQILSDQIISIVPDIMIMVLIYYATFYTIIVLPCILLEQNELNYNPFRSMYRSYQLISTSSPSTINTGNNNSRCTIIQIMIIFIMIWLSIEYCIANYVRENILYLHQSSNSTAVIVFVALLDTVLMYLPTIVFFPLLSILQFLIYIQLRIEKEGYDYITLQQDLNTNDIIAGIPQERRRGGTTAIPSSSTTTRTSRNQQQQDPVSIPQISQNNNNNSNDDDPERQQSQLSAFEIGN